MSDDQENVSITVWSRRMFRSNALVSDYRRTVQETPPPIRILVIGAGYAGLLFTLRLAGKVARQHVQIALVNESDTFTERPGIYVWVGKRRYERAQRRQQAREQNKQMQPRRA